MRSVQKSRTRISVKLLISFATVLALVSLATSRDGKSKSEQVTQAICAITESAAEVKRLVDGIGTSSEEQTRGVGRVVAAIAQIESVTQANAAGAQETAAAAEELSAQAAALRNVVGDIVALVEN